MVMQTNNKHGKGAKAHNYLDAKKANIRRNEKYQRANEKEHNAKV